MAQRTFPGSKTGPPPHSGCRRAYTRVVGIGRVLIIAGVALVILGLLVSFGGRLPLRLGRLPGDIYIRGRNTSFYFPLATCVLLSVVFSLVLWIFRR